MPCRDEDLNRQIELEQIENMRVHIEKLEAALCGILTKLEQDDLFATIIYDVNWDEAGVDRKFLEKWWKAHKEADAKRRAKEAEAARKKAEREAKKRQREEILAKLTPEERELLGL